LSGAALPANEWRRGTAVAGLTHAAELSQVRLLADEQVAQKDCSARRLDQDFSR